MDNCIRVYTQIPVHCGEKWGLVSGLTMTEMHGGKGLRTTQVSSNVPVLRIRTAQSPNGALLGSFQEGLLE